MHDTKLQFDAAFPHAYRIQAELPRESSVPRYGPRNGLPLFVIPETAEPFVYTLDTDNQAPSVLSWPNPEFFLIRAGGELVDTSAPHSSVRLAALEGHAVSHHLLLPERQLAILGSCGGIFCYGTTGLKWNIDLKCNASQAIFDTFESELIVIAHDPVANALQRHRFDLTSGDWLGDAAVL